MDKNIGGVFCVANDIPDFKIDENNRDMKIRNSVSDKDSGDIKPAPDENRVRSVFKDRIIPYSLIESIIRARTYALPYVVMIKNRFAKVDYVRIAQRDIAKGVVRCSCTFLDNYERTVCFLGIEDLIRILKVIGGPEDHAA